MFDSAECFCGLFGGAGWNPLICIWMDGDAGTDMYSSGVFVGSGLSLA